MTPGERLPIAALVTAIVGLTVLAVGVWWASIIFDSSPAAYAAQREGRAIVVAGSALVLLAGSLLAAGGRPVRGLLVVLPGAVCTGVAFAKGLGDAYPVLVFYPLPALVALGAAISAAASAGLRRGG